MLLSQQIQLSTERLLLKSITPAIIHALFENKTKDEIMHYFGTDESGYAHLKDMHEKGMETHRISLLYFLLIDKNTLQVTGECGFHTWNKTHERAELFYFLKHDAHKRNGLITEALKVVLPYGFNELGLHRIAAFTADNNLPSKSVLNKFGFRKEGTMREDYVVNGVNENSEGYALLKWEYK